MRERTSIFQSTLTQLMLGGMIVLNVASCTSSVTVDKVLSKKQGACADATASNADPNAAASSKKFCAPATSLTWAESSPQSVTTQTTSITATWTKSASNLLANQKIQFYTGASCETASGDLIDLNSATAQSQTFSGTAGNTYTFKITSLDSNENALTSDCATSMELRIPDTTAPIITFISISPTSPGSSLTPSVTISLTEATATSGLGLYSDASCTTSISSPTTGTPGSNTLTASSIIVNNATIIYAKATDAAGNESTCTIITTYIQDNTAPTITNVTSSNSNGSYKAGQAISIQVVFSESVTVTGTPKITMATGSTDAVANFVSGSGSTTLTFTYAISSGHMSSDLDYLSESALALYGGGIKDAASNNAILTLPTPGASKSLGANRDIVIDTSIPTITTIPAQSTDLNTPTSAITFSIGDLGSSIVCNSAYLTLVSSNTSLVTSSSVIWAGTYPNCTAVITPVTNGNGTASLTITVNDLAGNTATSTFNLVIRSAFVVGQPSSTVNKQMEMGLYYNSDTLIVGGKLFVADYLNHRVLVWNTVPASYGQAASFVLGQPDFFSNTANNGGVSASSMNMPTGIYSDGTKLFVADTYNHRVLVWNTLPTMAGQPANFALGQPDLTSNSVNNGGISGSSMNYPESVRSLGTRLFVSDAVNNRVLVWNTMPTTSGQSASYALGQPNLTSNTANNGGVSASTLSNPWGLAISGTKLFVSDNFNYRVLVWNTIPTFSGQSADFVLGQPNMSSNASNNGGVSGASLSAASNIFIDGTKLFVADHNNSRVLVWNTIPTATAQPASFALGQPDLTSNTQNNGGVSGSSMNTPYGMFSDGTKLYVNDSMNNRVLVWNTMPTASGQSASFALGQSDLISNGARLYYKTSSILTRPNNVFSDGNRLVVSDGGMHRVLIYNSVPTSSGQSADIVLGQSNFSSAIANNGGVSGSSLNSPQAAIIVGSKFFVSDFSNNRVLAWNSIPTSNGQTADFVLGQPNLTSNAANNGGISGSRLNGPLGLYSDGTKFYVVDSNNHRVLVWNSVPTTSDQSASFALGQANLTSNSNGTTATTMNAPRGVYSNGTRLFVSETNNHRVLIWNSLPTLSGQAADVSIGQPNLTSGTANNGGISASTLSNPQGVYLNGTKLYVSDYGNNRILIWNTIPTTNGQAADAVFGQSDLTANSANAGGLISAFGVNGPLRSFVTGARLFVPDFNNSRIVVIPAP